MNEHDVLKKNRNFYIGVGCFTLLCSFCGRVNLT